MKKSIIIIFAMLLPIMANADNVEGIYQVQLDSYRYYNGNNVSYSDANDIQISKNDDGTYYVTDMFGGWYSHRLGYGKNYEMAGKISIDTDGSVTLLESFVIGWGDSLVGFKGSYDSKTSTFKIEAEYVSGMIFYQTWVKKSQVEIFSYEGINYKIVESNTVSVIEGNYDGDIIIPNQVSYNGVDYSVSSIVNGAFSGCTGLTSVTIPYGVTSITRVFSGCTSLKSVIIPNSLKEIGEGAFFNCIALKEITIPNSVEKIGDEAFGSCSSLTSITIPGSVESIGSSAFAVCNSLYEVNIQNGVKIICDGVFDSCSKLEKIVIPQSLKQIGLWIISSTPIKNIQVESGNPVYDSRNNCNAIIETASNTLVLGCKNTIIPNNVKTIGESAFSYCMGLSSINIPNSVTSIDKNAFFGSKDLTNISITSSLENIGWGAFTSCEGLLSFDFLEGLKTIQDRAFQGCSSITSINIPKSVKMVGEAAFHGCYSVETIKVDEDNPVYDSRNNCNAILETASNVLVAGCKNTIIPNSISTIGNYAFSGCQKMASIIIPNSVSRIGNDAFTFCKSLTSVDLPYRVNDIGAYAFSYCENLKTVTVRNCNNIPSLIFYECPNIRDLYFYMDNIPETSNNTFQGTDVGFITLHVPASIINQYKSSEPWKSFKEIVELDMTNIPTLILKDSRDNIYYNLQGQRKNNPLKGIYIKDGKKIIIR